ncbi:MAG: hypothetical protein ACOX3H_06980 [Saccharofermentanales bacterium]|jgi:hypothetical protein
MKRNLKLILVLTLIFVLVGTFTACGKSEEKTEVNKEEKSEEKSEGKTEEKTEEKTEGKAEGNLETFLSEAEGDWYAYGNLDDLKLTINTDGSFTADYDDQTTDEGTISYDEDNEKFAFEGREQGYYGEFLEEDILLFWGNRYYRADQSIEFGQYNGSWYLDGDLDSDYYELEDGKWMFMAKQSSGHATDGQGHMEYRGGDEYQLHLYEYVDDDEPIVAFNINGENELIMKENGASYERIDTGDDSSSDFDIDVFLSDDETDEEDESGWVIEEVSESESGIKYEYPYFADGDVAGGRLYLNEDGTCLITSSESDVRGGTYSEDKDAGTIEITVDGGDTVVLSVEDDGASLESEQGERLICVAAQYLPDKNGEYPDAYYDHPITPGSTYYLNGDHDDYSLFFFDISSVTLKYSADDEELFAYYSIDDDVMKISEMDSFDGFELTIGDDGKTLVTEDGERFLLDE